MRPPSNRGNRAVPERKRVGEEHEIELSSLRELGELDVVAEVRAGVDLRFWVQPGRNVVASRMKKRAEFQVTLPCHDREPSTTPFSAPTAYLSQSVVALNFAAGDATQPRVQAAA